MATYFEAINDNNKIVIDDKTTRLSLSRELKLSSVGVLERHKEYRKETDEKYTSNIWCEASSYTVNIFNTEIVFALKLTKDFGEENCVILYQMNPTLLRVVVFKSSKSNDSIDTIVSKITLLTYGNVQSNDKFGIEIFDENSNKIYHSSNKLLNIIGQSSNIADGQAELSDKQKYYLTTFNVENSAIILSSIMAGWAALNKHVQGTEYCYVYGLSVKDGAYIAKLTSGSLWYSGGIQELYYFFITGRDNFVAIGY